MCLSLVYRLFRNSASQTVRQRLVFVGSEEGKILALRQIFNEVLFSPFAYGCDVQLLPFWNVLIKFLVRRLLLVLVSLP